MLREKRQLRQAKFSVKSPSDPKADEVSALGRYLPKLGGDALDSAIDQVVGVWDCVAR